MLHKYPPVAAVIAVSWMESPEHTPEGSLLDINTLGEGLTLNNALAVSEHPVDGSNAITVTVCGPGGSPNAGIFNVGPAK